MAVVKEVWRETKTRVHWYEAVTSGDAITSASDLSHDPLML